MDGRGGCCIARYAATGGHAAAAAAYDMSQMDRIMLKFRPIAPKPAAAGAAPAASDGGSDGHGKAASGGRGRRKGCKDGNGGGSNSSRRCTNVGRKRKSCSPDQTAGIVPDHRDHDQKAVMTLPLLPESPDLSPTAAKQPHKMPFWLSFNSSAVTTNTPPEVQDNYGHSHCHVAPDPTVTISPAPLHHHHHHHHLSHNRNNQVVHQSHPVVKSCVIVEGITDTCPPEGVARDVRALEKDTCPVIISDGWNRVVWANEAYRRMVGMGDTWRDRRMLVSVEMREKVPERVQAFTCRVRVHRSNGGNESRGSSSSSASFPCDVWRIDGGGFAWRLDVDAALSLGSGGK